MILRASSDLLIHVCNRSLQRMESISCSSASREKTAMAEADICLSPPVKEFALLDFAALEKIVEAGYQYARKEIKKLRHNKVL